METLYYYDREDLYKMILLSKQTRCGVYWIDQDIVSRRGLKHDEGFWLDRVLFFKKCFWTPKDLCYLMAVTPSPKLFLNDWLLLNSMFVEDNKDLIKKKLSDRVGLNKVDAIIDNYLYIKDYYYAT